MLVNLSHTRSVVSMSRGIAMHCFFAGNKAIAATGFELKYFQFIDAESILESVAILPKPTVFHQHGGLYLTACDCEDDDRILWVHNIGVTRQGESG